jgi:hypothetical protein
VLLYTYHFLSFFGFFHHFYFANYPRSGAVHSMALQTMEVELFTPFRVSKLIFLFVCMNVILFFFLKRPLLVLFSFFLFLLKIDIFVC